MKIIEYNSKYRDDLIFMILEAKDNLGKVPSINPDLLNIEQKYINKGDKFWLAIDDNDRVIGSICYSSIYSSTEVFLHRLFIKPTLKRQGIGSQLLQFAEDYLKKIGKTHIRIHLGEPREQWYESYNFYPKYGYNFYDKNHLIKQII
ncbi:GNAT family N-acetyltransferase [Streptococcus halichoeri]|uniref:GNAT family N-acetyltransferase n=1 Tax=Streptococcus halichoeri TaxID=254785 RepID=UPI001F2A952D|nr:GNAT family N-acetyltransferase [Streptococcus halichoeri]